MIIFFFFLIEYLSLIGETAKSLNLYKKLMEDMEQMIMKNIKEAEEQLQEVSKKKKRQ